MNENFRETAWMLQPRLVCLFHFASRFLSIFNEIFWDFAKNEKRDRRTEENVFIERDDKNFFSCFAFFLNRVSSVIRKVITVRDRIKLKQLLCLIRLETETKKIKLRNLIFITDRWKISRKCKFWRNVIQVISIVALSIWLFAHRKAGDHVKAAVVNL